MLVARRAGREVYPYPPSLDDRKARPMSATLTARLNVLLRELPAIRKMDDDDYRREAWCRRKAALLRSLQELDERKGDDVGEQLDVDVPSPRHV